MASKITDVLPIRLPKPVVKAVGEIAAREGCRVNDVLKRAVVAEVERVKLSNPGKREGRDVATAAN